MEKLNFHIISFVSPNSPKEWMEDCINSVKMQTVPSTHHIFVDKDQKLATQNHFETLQKIEAVSSNIIIHLDGDDSLITPRVLEMLEDHYQDSEIWATYGNYVSKAPSVCKPLDDKPFRHCILNGGWRYSHLRTFRAHLIPYLKEQHCKDINGNWYAAAADVAVFLPMLEMSGKDRVRFINEDLVYYRIHNNCNHTRRDLAHNQIRCAYELSARKPFSRLERL